MRLKFILIFVVIMIFPMTMFGCTSNKNEFGIFLSDGNENIERLVEYDEVIVDATYFSPEDVEYLHSKGVKVYSYLNIGSIEDFRDYYEEFVTFALDDYENWPGEKWMDMSKEQWQAFICEELAKELNNKGIDGFFLDNVDVYYKYPTESVFIGIENILTGLKDKYNKTIIINNGYEFVMEAQKKEIEINELFDAVLKESVFTQIIDFENDIFEEADEEELRYSLQYLENIKSNGIDVYVIEYTKDEELKDEVIYNLEELEYQYFISDKVGI